MGEKEITNHFDGLEVRQHSDFHGIDPEVPEGKQLALQSLLGQDMRMIVSAIALRRDGRNRNGNLAAKIVTCLQVCKYSRSPRAVGSSDDQQTGHFGLTDGRR